jgi:hypothetical protein
MLGRMSEFIKLTTKTATDENIRRDMEVLIYQE